MAKEGTTEAAVAPLVIRNLRKVYSGKGGQAPVVAVHDVSLTVGRGLCLGLLGPNGSGKTTTIACATGFNPATSGTVELFGIDAHENPKAARRHLGVCAQQINLDSDFTVIDQLMRHAAYFDIGRQEARRRAGALLERFGLTEKAGVLVEHLSGGMQRRLQVARALINEPRLLILDEPTTGLDPDARRGLWRILAGERERGLAVLLSTHYMDEAERLCDRIALIHKGRILDEADPPTLIRRHVGEAEVEEEVRPGHAFKRPPNLEDVFLKLGGRHLGQSI